METTNQFEETLIRAKFDSLGRMFIQPTLEFFDSTFTKDCDYITFQGQHLKGAEENFEAHKKLSALWIFKGCKLEGKIVSVKFLAPHIATVIATGGIKFRFQKKLPSNRLSINSYVFVKEDGNWKIASFQNTRIQGPGFFRGIFNK
jgi:uncharacterized protein (TIGR02246 family)